jgi:hypothetical protein
MAADPARWHAPVLTIVGLLLCWFGIRALGASYAITRWPVVPARVTLSTVEPTSSDNYHPRVEYEFYLAGLRYVGAGLEHPAMPGEQTGMEMTRERAESVIAEYPVGQELLAGYDPVNPSRAVLRPRFNWWTTVPAAAGGIVAALGILLWRRNRIGRTPEAP